jgi:hypothetical protein
MAGYLPPTRSFKACKAVSNLILGSLVAASQSADQFKAIDSETLDTINSGVLHYPIYPSIVYTIVTIFVNLGLFRHFETVTNTRTWIKNHTNIGECCKMQIH